jgi:hypothetical protein
MDFRQTVQPSNNRPAPAVAAAPSPESHHKERPGKSGKRDISRWFAVVLFAGIAVLLVGIIFAFSNAPREKESQFIKHDKYQAVFLNNGQVYFGNVNDLNSQYVRMSDIFYLTQTTTSDNSTSNGNYTLVKLGCQQIHGPSDEMIINRDQVSFWENIEDNGKVAQSIKQFKQQNPNGPDCSQVSNQTQADSSSSQSSQNSTSTNSNTTNNSTTKK